MRKLITIGTTSGKITRYCEETKTIGVYGTSIKLYGARTKAEAIAQCERNLKGFVAVR